MPVRVTDGRRRHARGFPWKATTIPTSVQKLAGFDVEPFGDQFQRGEADVAFAPFDGADIGSVEPRPGCQLFLRDPQPLPPRQDMLRKLAMKIPRSALGRHPVNITAMMTLCLQTISSGTADGVPGTPSMGVHGGVWGAARCNSDASSGRCGADIRKPRRYGLPGHSVHLESIWCSGVGERTRTSTGY